MEYGRKILVWNGIGKKILGMEYGMKILGMEWKWNGRKLPVCNMEKSSSIPYHALIFRGGVLEDVLGLEDTF